MAEKNKDGNKNEKLKKIKKRWKEKCVKKTKKKS